jgi:hypothetical protein
MLCRQLLLYSQPNQHSQLLISQGNHRQSFSLFVMDQPYFPNPPFQTPLTPVPSAPASPYDHHSLGGFTTSSFEDFPDDSAVFQMYEVRL